MAQMDDRIRFLNRLKLRLNDYIQQGNKKEENYAHNYTKIPSSNISSLRAHMLMENVKSGIALEGVFFDNSGVYAEYSVDGTLSFHIYPKLHTHASLDEPNVSLDNEKKSITKQELLSRTK